MTRSLQLTACVIAGALAFAVTPRAEAPQIYAIRGARLVTASGAANRDGHDCASQRAHRRGRR